MSAHTIAGRVRSHLAELPASSRATLFMALERERLWGADDPTQNFILAQLRAVVSELGETVPRVPSPERLFFAGVEGFLVDPVLPVKLPGRVPRAHLGAIWTWISRDIAPGEVKSMKLALTERFGLNWVDHGRESAVEELAQHFRQSIVKRVRHMLDTMAASQDLMRKHVAVLGGDRVYIELVDVISIIDATPDLAKLAEGLPERVDPHAPETPALLQKLALEAYQKGGDRLVAYLARVVGDRMDSSAHLPRVVVQALGTKDVKPLAAAPLGRFVDLVVSDIEWSCELVVKALGGSVDAPSACGALRNYNTLARQLRAALELDATPSEWNRRVVAARGRVSERLGHDFGELTTLLRRVLRSLRSFGSKPPVAPDQFDLERCCGLITVFDVAQLSSGELALNELLARTRGDLDLYIDTVTTALTEELRVTGSDRRDVVEAYAAAALRVNEARFGPHQAGLLRRSFEVAAGRPLPSLRRVAA